MTMKKIILLLAITALSLTATRALAVVTATPSSVSLPRSLKGDRTLTVTFTVTMGYAVVNSAGGTFTAGTTVLGTVNRALTPVMTPISAAVPTWRGSVSEPLSIPATYVRKALKLGFNSIRYVRNFQGGGGPEPGTVTIRITSRGCRRFHHFRHAPLF
jgi:hypothetical protein